MRNLSGVVSVPGFRPGTLLAKNENAGSEIRRRTNLKYSDYIPSFFTSSL